MKIEDERTIKDEICLEDLKDETIFRLEGDVVHPELYMKLSYYCDDIIFNPDTYETNRLILIYDLKNKIAYSILAATKVVPINADIKITLKD